MDTAWDFFFQLSYTFGVVSGREITMATKRKVYMAVSPSFVFSEDHAQVPMMVTYNPIDQTAFTIGACFWLRPKEN